MARPSITSDLTVGSTRGVAFSYQIVATNSPTSYAANISPSGLPPGLSVNTTTGLISGTPTATSNWSVHLSATNADGTGTKNLALHVVNPGAPYINSEPSAIGTVGSIFSYQIVAGGGIPTSYNATFLPDGLTVDTGTGIISGTPTLAGTYASGRITVTNASGTDSIPMQYSIDSGGGGAPVVTSALGVTIFLGDPLTYTIVGTNTPTSYGATSLPTGLSVNTATGVISGTTTAAPGQYTVPISAINGTGTGTANLVINILAMGTVTPPDLDIPKGLFSYTPVGASVSGGIQGHPYFIGVSIAQSWAAIELTQGVYDFDTYFTPQIQRLTTGGKKILLRIQTASGFKSSGGNVPDYVATLMGVVASDKHITPGKTYSYDPSQGGGTICQPVFWDVNYWARKKALYQAFGNWLTNTTTLTQTEKDSVKIISISYANIRTEDFNVPHRTSISNVGGPDGTGYVLSELNRWLHLPGDADPGAGYTRQKMIDIAIRSDNQGLIDVAIAAFPGKFITHASGSNGASLDSPGDENYLCRTVYDTAKAKYPGRFIIQRNNVSDLTPIESVSNGTPWELMGDEAEDGQPLGGQNLAKIWGDTTDTGGNGYLMNGGVNTDPDGVLPPPLTASQIYRKSSQKIASYGAFYNEVYEQDALFQSLDDSNYVQSLFSGALIVPGEIPVITSALTLTLTVGDPATSYQIIATNNPSSYDAAVLKHPEGLAVTLEDSVGGVVTLLPIRVGMYQVVLKAINTTGIGTAQLIVTVIAAPPGGGTGSPPPITSVALYAFPEVSPFSEDEKDACPTFVANLGASPPSAVLNLVVTTPMKSNSGVATATWTPPIKS